MRGRRAVRLSVRGRRSALSALGALLAAGALMWVLSGTAAAASCTDNFTGASGGDWATAANWTSAADSTIHAVPTASDVVCSSVTVAVSEAGDTADSIQFTGADLNITSGGTLTLTSATDASNAADVSLAGGGTLGGAGQTLTVSGTFTWGAGAAGAATLNNTTTLPGANLAIAAGTVTMDNTSTPTFDGGSVSTATAVTLGANLTVAGTTALTTTSTITANATVAGTGATFTAAGVAAGATPSYGFGTNSLVLTGGTTTVAGANTLSIGSLALQGGTLQVDGGLTPSPGAVTVTGGTLKGTGTINGAVVNTSGTVSPGDSTPGTVTVSGNYSQGAGGTLAIGLASSSAFGQLLVQGGTAGLGGTLTLTDASGFTPTGPFSILASTGARTGTFATIGGPNASTYYEQYGPNGVTLVVTPSSCPASNFDAYAAAGGNWSTAANWSQGAPPSGTQVACWAAGTTVTVSDAESADSIQAGGTLSIVSGGALKLTSSSHGSSVGALALEVGGELDGPTSPSTQTLTVTGNVDWGGGTGSGTAALNAAASSNLAINQTAGAAGTMAIDGTNTSTPAFDGGSVSTNSPVSITNSNFQGVSGATLTATGQAVTLGSGVNLTSGTGGTIVAAGLDTTGASNAVQSFALHLTTGATSSLAAPSTLSVKSLTTDSGTTLPVPSGVAVNILAGTIAGTVNGAGTFTTGTGATELTATGTLSTASVAVPAGTLTVDSGATYSPGATTVSGGGILNLAGNGSTGALSVEGGQLNGGSGVTLTVTGAFDWGASATAGSAGTINANTGNALAISQTGGGAFRIDSPAGSTPTLAGGSLSTTSPVSITSPTFATTHTPTLTTSSTITVGTSVAISGTGATFTAAGVNPTGAAAQTYGFGGDGLTLTGGTTTVAAGSTLASGPLSITGGTLQDDGTVTPSSTTLTGGTLEGTGTVTGDLTQTSGTLSPGDGAPGILTVTGKYMQGSGATLAVEIDGTTAGTGTGFFGQLKVNGTASVSGTLSVTDVSGFSPGQANTFAILTSSALSGEFTQLTGNAAATYFAQYGAQNVTLAVTSSSCPANNFDAYAPTSGNWSTAANWSLGRAPKNAEVACWAAGVTVTVSNAQSVNLIQAGGTLNISGGGVLTIGSGTTTTSSTVGGLQLEGGGELDGAAGHLQGLNVVGPFDWGGTGTGTAALNVPAASNLEVTQPGGQTMTVDGTTTPAFDRGLILTASPVTITNSNFTGAAGATLTVVNQPVTFGSSAAGVNLATGTGTIVAAGIDTLGATNTVKGFALHLTTGATSALAAAGTLNVQNLTTDTGTSLAVPAGSALNVFAGTISGAIAGAGTFTAGVGATGGTTEIKSGGSLTTPVTVGPGSVTVDAGATYGAVATTVGAGSLTLNAAATTGALALAGTGQVNGVNSNALTDSGALTWTAGTLSKLALTQTGTGFSLSGTGTKALAGGSISTGSPVSITGTHFQTSGTPTLTTTSTITLGSTVAITGSGATFVAAGLGPASGTSAGMVATTYDFGASEALKLTGGVTTVTNTGLLETGPLSLTAGVLQDDGSIAPAATTLTGGILQGTGTISGAVTNTSGTVAPGDGGPGLFTIGGNYTQGNNGTLAVALGGTAAGSGYGQLQVSGTAALGGNLSLTDVGAFTPGPSDSFKILSSTGARTGAMTLTGPSSGFYHVSYDANDITLTASPTPTNTVAPAITGTAAVGQTLTCSNGTWSESPTTFTYQWNRNGSPIAGAMSPAYVVSTADRGTALTCTVTASNNFGQGSPATSAALTIPAPPGMQSAPFNVVAPTVTGTPTPGNRLSCSSGSWLQGPSAFTYQWARGGSPIAGATGSAYTVQIADEGATLTCLVSASNAGGPGVPTASTGIVVALPGTLGCPKPTGKVSGRSLGPLQLGFKRARARRALPHSPAGGGQEFYCLYGGWGIHAGYMKGRIALALTSNPFYALNGAHPGMAIAAVAKGLHLGKVIHLGANDWYLVPGSASRGLLRVRAGVIEEIGIAALAPTTTRSGQRRFLSAFNNA